jgi:hypothetical protein
MKSGSTFFILLPPALWSGPSSGPVSSLGTNVVSTPAVQECAGCVPSREVHVVSKKSIVFLPSPLLRSCSLILVEGEERKKRNAQVEGLKKQMAESWPASTIYRKVGSKRDANGALSLVGQ